MAWAGRGELRREGSSADDSETRLAGDLLPRGVAYLITPAAADRAHAFGFPMGQCEQKNEPRGMRSGGGSPFLGRAPHPATMSDSPHDNDSLGVRPRSPLPTNPRLTIPPPQSSFVSSFSLPPPSPAPEPKPSHTSQTDATDVEQLIIPRDENTNAEAPDPVVRSEPSSGGGGGPSEDPSAVTNATTAEDWKSTLDKHLEGWRAESADARAKSESTRLRLAEELAAERKRLAEEEAAERERLRRQSEEEEVEKKVKELLQSPARGKKHSRLPAQHRQGVDEKRWAAVRSAWEVAQGASHAHGAQPVQARSEFEEEEPVEVDGRDMVAGDHGGRDGNKAAEVLQVCARFPPPGTHAADGGPQKISQATETVTHSSGNVNPTPASATRRADLLSASGGGGGSASNAREAVAEAWQGNAQKAAEEKDAGGASGQKHPEAAEGQAEDAPRASHPSQPPSQPPSLTLSLFTSRLTPARIAAVVGINVVLPFINGVMLGFGEIFARECIRFVRGVWRGERAALGWRGVAGVGLREGARAVDVSGSASFP